MLPSPASLRHSGPFWMVLASILFACMGVFVKLGATHFRTSELVFYRCFVGFLVVGLVALWQGGTLKSPVLGKHLSRGIAGTISLMLYFYGIAHLPLATAVTLNYTSPLFMALLTVVWFREGASKRLLVSMVVGFLGVVLLLQPTLERNQWLAGLLGLASGFGSAIAYMNVRALGQAGEPEWRTVFYFSLIATLAAAVWMIPGGLSPITWGNAWLLAGMGACATGAQLAMTRAYRKGHSLVVASLAYTTVLCASLFGIVLWNDPHPWSAWLAMGLIAFSGMYAAKRQG